MLCHHILVSFCLLFSYFTHNFTIGTVILYIHDWGDLAHKVIHAWRVLSGKHMWIPAMPGFFLFPFVRVFMQPVWFWPVIFKWQESLSNNTTFTN